MKKSYIISQYTIQKMRAEGVDESILVGLINNGTAEPDARAKRLGELPDATRKAAEDMYALADRINESQSEYTLGVVVKRTKATGVAE